MNRDRDTPPRRRAIPTIGRIAFAVAIGLAIAYAFLLGPVTFMAIPWRIRWWMGEIVFLALLAALMGLLIRRARGRPWATLDPDAARGGALHRAVAVGLQAITLSFALPLFANPEGWGAIGDWDLHLQWYEALRKSVLEYGQFPWWNPWTCGGWVLAAEPQFGLAAIDTPLVLIFGTSVGLRLAAVAEIMLAVEGTRRLARIWLADPWAVAAASVIYSWSGAMIIFTVGCRALTMAYPFLPWMLLYAFRIDRGRRQAIGLGVAAAASVMAVIQYQTAYTAIIVALVLLFGGLALSDRRARARYAALVVLATGVCLMLAGWRLALSGLVFADYPRKFISGMDFSIKDMIDSLVNRAVPPADIYQHTHRPSPDWFPELWCYVGPVAVVAMLLSLRRGWRWWHTLMFGGLAMAWGAMRVYHPSYWVQTWPVFSSMHVVTRWRVPAMLGLGLAAGSEIQSWRAGGRWLRTLGAAMALAIVADLAIYAHQCLPSAHSIPPSDVHAPPRKSGGPMAVNLLEWEAFGNTEGFECIKEGYGVIRGYCPQLGYDRRRKTSRLWLGHPDYVGEIWSGRTPIEPESWSPNRIEIRVEPHQEVRINQNPGSWWWVNGIQVFPDARCAELNLPFIARADAEGRIVLEIRPRGLPLALGLTLAGLALACVCYRLVPRLGG